MRIICLLLFCLYLLLGVKAQGTYKSAPYAQWAHSHVVWMHENDQSEATVYQLIKDYKEHGIPVGGINLEPTWTTCINNYVVNRAKFPNLQKMIQDLHQNNIKIILWTTSLINKECPQHKEGLAKNYFLNKGKTVHWWKGEGSFIDFFNKDAKLWFQRLMDRVISMGIDGWKCDGAQPLVYMIRPLPYSHGAKRFITFPQYADQYYGTFYNYTKSINPQTLIMSRPVDSYQGYAYSKYSPKYVMFSGWVGDQHNTVEGFKIAMENIIHSASQNYLNFGFDIGAYKADQNTPKYLFLRWAQVGALLPFMENGGGGKHQPWLFDEETVDIYRKFTLLHYQLREFFLTAGTEAYAKGKSVLQPITKDKKKVELNHNYNLGYVLWNTFLVSPIFEESGFVEVVFPKGFKWVYFFDHSKVYDGGATRYLGIKLDETALFMRSNSIVPINRQLWFVYLEQGNYTKTVVVGDYSDDVSVEYINGGMVLRVDRFYKDEEVRQRHVNQESIRVRFIGLANKPMMRDSNSNGALFTATEYQNQFQAEIPLRKQVEIYKLVFSYPELIFGYDLNGQK